MSKEDIDKYNEKVEKYNGKVHVYNKRLRRREWVWRVCIAIYFIIIISLILGIKDLIW